jgi:hypothetical protein
MKLTAPLAALLCAAISAHPAAAQPKPIFKLVKSIGTSAEATQIQSLVTRVQTRVEGDATFYKQLQDNFAKHNLLAAKTLIVPVAQLKSDEVWFANPGTRTSSVDRASLFRFASEERMNPFAVLVIVGTKGICFGTKASCTQAFKDIGWEIDS